MKIENKSCPECERHSLRAATRSMTVVHDGSPLEVSDLECYRCSDCGAEVAFPEQIRRNQLLIADAKRDAMGLLRGEQIRALREAFGFSQPDAARIFGGGPNAFSKYERGEVLQSVPMDRLMKVVAAYPLVLAFLQVEAGIDTATRSGYGYAGAGLVSLNDSAFRSRSLKSEEVVVSISDWKIKKSAA